MQLDFDDKLAGLPCEPPPVGGLSSGSSRSSSQEPDIWEAYSVYTMCGQLFLVRGAVVCDDALPISFM